MHFAMLLARGDPGVTCAKFARATDPVLKTVPTNKPRWSSNKEKEMDVTSFASTGTTILKVTHSN